MRKRSKSRRSVARRRPSVSQADRLASLKWNITDATEALRNAVSMGAWDKVIKYASQLKVLERKLSQSSMLGSRRAGRNLSLSSANMEAHERNRRAGRFGVP